MKRVPINTGGIRMKSTDSEPRFIEPGDDQDECLALPLYVTRQVDDEIRILKTIRQGCAGYTS